MHSICTPKGSNFSLPKYPNPAYFQNIEKSDIPLTVHLLPSQLIENEYAALPDDRLLFSSDSDIQGSFLSNFHVVRTVWHI